ncbi:hypothetical protein MMC2321_00286 [Chitinophaga sp. MM2321]
MVLIKKNWIAKIQNYSQFPLPNTHKTLNISSFLADDIYHIDYQ